MRTWRKIAVAAGAPLIVVTGLAGGWAYHNAAQLKGQIEAWADSLEASAHPVVMRLPFIPMYVDGRRLGRLETVVVQRERPGAIDSLRLEVAHVDDLSRLQSCSLQLDPDAFDRHGPMGLREAVRCRPDTVGMVRFGTVAFPDARAELPLYLMLEDLPCDHLSDPTSAPCTQLRDEIRQVRDQVRSQVRVQVRTLRDQIRAEVRGR